MNFLRPLLSLSVLATFGAVYATDYAEEEPNDGFPPSFLAGNPVFQAGDRFVGTVDLGGDLDSHYLTFQGSGAPGIYRYTFDIDTGGGDSVIDLFDTTTDGWFLAFNDDFQGLDSRAAPCSITSILQARTLFLDWMSSDSTIARTLTTRSRGLAQR